MLEIFAARRLSRSLAARADAHLRELNISLERRVRSAPRSWGRDPRPGPFATLCRTTWPPLAADGFAHLLRTRAAGRPERGWLNLLRHLDQRDAHENLVEVLLDSRPRRKPADARAVLSRCWWRRVVDELRAGTASVPGYRVGALTAPTGPMDCVRPGVAQPDRHDGKFRAGPTTAYRDG